MKFLFYIDKTTSTEEVVWESKFITNIKAWLADNNISDLPVYTSSDLIPEDVNEYYQIV